MPNPSHIPQHVEQIILPAKNMSVVDFLDFKLPLVTFPTKLVKVEDYFSTDSVMTDNVEEICSLPSLPVTMVQLLSQSLSLNNPTSVCCPHLGAMAGKRFPPWIVSFWSQLVSIWKVRCGWMEAKEYMEKDETSGVTRYQMSQLG